jgi:hypothetical protein
VPKRFPQLNFGFLEGGAGWACDIVHGLHEHFEKRNAENVRIYDPARIDTNLLKQLCAEYGPSGEDAVQPNPNNVTPERDPSEMDEFAASLLKDDDDLQYIFGTQFFFGCEADDNSVYRAIDAKANTFGLRLRPFFSSDIGHWDVPDISSVLLESHMLVDEGLLTADDYRDFVFTYPALLHAQMNPAFFDGTPVEGAAKALLTSNPRS